MKEPTKNHLVPGELTLTRASISSRFRTLTCQVLLSLLLTFACGLRAADTVYVGVSYELLKSTDAGATWNIVNVPLNTPFMKGYVTPQFLAIDPQNTSKIYFIGFAAAASSFFASADAGATWTVTPFIALQPTHLAVDFAGQTIYITASPNRTNTYVYKSTNTGASWTQLSTPATASEPSGSTVNEVFADPAVSGTVYALSDNGTYVFKSTDFGSTWSEIVQKVPRRPSYIDPHNHLIWYDVTGGSVDSILLKSTDGASSFTQLNIPSDEVTSVSVGAVSSTLYVTGDVSGLGGTVLKSTDGGDTWTPLQNGIFGSYTGIVWADPVDASTVFVNDSIYTNLYVSTDGGAHFNPSKLPKGPPDCVPGNCTVPQVFDLLFAASIPVPPVITSVVNGASFRPGVVANSWVTIQGTGLAPQTQDWSNSIVNGVLPTSLDGVSVTMGGKPAYIYFISPGQLNVLAPDVPAGPITVTVKTPVGTSANFATTGSVYDPAFFLWSGNQAVATRTDYSFAVKPGTFAGATTVAAKPGETLILWATGFGPTKPAVPGGVAVPSDQTYATATVPSISIGNIPATVDGAALASGSAGLYQIAIQVPGSLTDGDWPIQASIGGVASPTGAILSVHH